MKHIKQHIFLFIVLIIAVYLLIFNALNHTASRELANKNFDFNGKEALQLIKEQVALGPRYPGNEGHDKMVGWMHEQLHSMPNSHIEKQEWNQKGSTSDYELTNFILRVNPDSEKRIIVGTHFDTLKRSVDGAKPIPGANNGASGTAVMLQAIKTLSTNSSPLTTGVDFVFFDAEEGDPDIPPGSTANWSPWGSVYFGEHLDDLYHGAKPDHMINLDLVCSKNAQFYYEMNSLNSTSNQTRKFWGIGAKIDSRMFQPKSKYAVLDDHTVLQKYGVPSFLVIDFDYPPIHSTADTVDKCSSETLDKVGGTLLQYLYSL